MSALKTYAGVAIVLALSVFAAAGHAGAQTAVNFKPNQGVSLHLGPKHAVGYFLTDNGVCQLTLVVGDEIKEDDQLPTTASARFRAAVAAGKTARFDTGSGTELQFSCAPGAVAMTVEPFSQVAYTALHK